METITSAEGTEIAYERTGNGPPLVLVHGTTADHTRWDPLRPAFAEHFTVYAIDRRGRGESGDAAEYALEQEAEDVATVVDSLGESVVLLGHSYGEPSVRWRRPYEPTICTHLFCTNRHCRSATTTPTPKTNSPRWTT